MREVLFGDPANLGFMKVNKIYEKAVSLFAIIEFQIMVIDRDFTGFFMAVNLKIH